jgi:hypothetical protein
VVAAAGEPGEERAGGLNSVLRITGEADHGVLNAFRPQIGAIRRRRVGGRARFGGNRRWTDRIGHG